MNFKSFLIPIIYSSLVIVSVCIAFYGGILPQLNKITIIGWLLLLPFCLIHIKYIKSVNYNNTIGGRDATKEGLRFVVISTLILLVLQTIFFILDFKDYKIHYMNTEGFELAKLQIANGKLTIKESEIPALIQKEIEGVTLFKEYTAIIFKNLFLGVFASFIGGVFFKTKNSPVI